MFLDLADLSEEIVQALHVVGFWEPEVTLDLADLLERGALVLVGLSPAYEPTVDDGADSRRRCHDDSDDSLCNDLVGVEVHQPPLPLMRMAAVTVPLVTVATARSRR